MTQSDFESWLKTSFTVTGEYPERRKLVVDNKNVDLKFWDERLELSAVQSWQLIGRLCGLLTGSTPQPVSPVTADGQKSCPSCGVKMDLPNPPNQVWECPGCGRAWAYAPSGKPVLVVTITE